MKKIISTLIAVAVLSATSLFAQTKIQFEGKDIYNKNVTDAVFEDAKVTMVNIWGTFCGPCISEMPDLGKLNNEIKDFQVVGIVIDSVNRKGLPVQKTVDAAKSIAKQTGADYLHVIPDAKLQNGILSDVFAVPTTIFVDKNGNQIGETYTGSRSYSDWKKIIESLLK